MTRLIRLFALVAITFCLLGFGTGERQRTRGTIVFAARGPSNPGSELYVINADGSQLRQLTRNQRDEYGPSWSPNGSSIVFTSWVGRSPALIVRSANGHKRRILHQEPAAPGNARPVNTLYDPAWSPDGKRIAFTRARNDGAEVWTVGLTGRLRRVAVDPATDPSWSPKGERIAYATHRGLAIIRVRDRRVRAIRGTSRRDSAPAWSPNGRWIAFRRTTVNTSRREVDSLMIVSPSGKTARRILKRGVLIPAAWSPWSDAILCLHAPSAVAELQLVIVSVPGGRVSPVSGTHGAAGPASWRR